MRLYSRDDGSILRAVRLLEPGDTDRAGLTPVAFREALSFDTSTNDVLADEIDVDLERRRQIFNAPAQIAQWQQMQQQRRERITALRAKDPDSALIDRLTSDIAAIDAMIADLRLRVSQDKGDRFRLQNAILTRDGIPVVPSPPGRDLLDKQQLEQMSGQLDTLLTKLDAGTDLTVLERAQAIRLLLRGMRFVLRRTYIRDL